MQNFMLVPFRFILCCSLLFGLCFDVAGQSYWNAVVRIESPGERETGGGTGFCVSSDGESVEVWTAGHVVGPVGSEAFVIFNGGRRSRGVVTYRKYDGKGDGEDQAKIVCTKPDGKVATVPVCEADCDVGDLVFFCGFALGPNTQRQVQIKLTPNEPFPSRVSARPACDHGDSGGPVINGDGVVLGVVTQKTVERSPRLLFVPISKWVNED